MLPTLTDLRHREVYAKHLPLMRKAMKSAFNLTDEQLEKEDLINWMLDAPVYLTDYAEFDGEPKELHEDRKANDKIYTGELEPLVKSLRESYPLWRGDDKWSLIFKAMNRYHAYPDELMQTEVEEKTETSIGTEVVSEADKTEEIPIVSTDTESVPSEVISEEVTETPDRLEEEEPKSYVEAVEEPTTTESEVVEPEVTPTVAEETPIVEVKPVEPEVVEKPVIPSMLQTNEQKESVSSLTVEAPKTKSTPTQNSALTESVMREASKQVTSTEKDESSLQAEKPAELRETTKSEEHRIDDNSPTNVSGKASDTSDKLLQNKNNIENKEDIIMSQAIPSAANALLNQQKGLNGVPSKPTKEGDDTNLLNAQKWASERLGNKMGNYASTNFMTTVIVKEEPVRSRQQVYTFTSAVDPTYSREYTVGKILKPGSNSDLTTVINDKIESLKAVTGYKEFKAVKVAGEMGEVDADALTQDTRDNKEKFPHCVKGDADKAAVILEFLEGLRAAKSGTIQDSVKCVARKMSASILGVGITPQSTNVTENYTVNKIKALLLTETLAVYTQNSISESVDAADKILIKARKVAVKKNTNNNNKTNGNINQQANQQEVAKFTPAIVYQNISKVYAGEAPDCEMVPYFENSNGVKSVSSKVYAEIKRGDDIVRLQEASFRYYEVDAKGAYVYDDEKKKKAGVTANAPEFRKVKTWSWAAFVETVATSTTKNEKLATFTPDKAITASNANEKDKTDYTKSIGDGGAIATMMASIKSGNMQLTTIEDVSLREKITEMYKDFNAFCATQDAEKDAQQTVADTKKAGDVPAPGGAAPKLPTEDMK